ncbi:hypothetical protein F4604DRAFT_1925279 [Suillus subluteus]|nr:hypothetical protein F4604DRAFT_1925279 [Suillus subluteus]
MLTCNGQRGAALGETPLPSAPRSIFECISKKDQERIKNIAASHFAPLSTSDDLSPGPSLPTPPTKLLSTVLSPSQPIHLSRQGAIPPSQKPGQTPEEFTKEMSNYAKSAALFRAVSRVMAGRFTSAAVLDLRLAHACCTASEGMDSVDMAEEKPKEEVKEEAPKVHAARFGMDGVMTRGVCTWKPARLLCERFGVKDPVLEQTNSLVQGRERRKWRVGGSGSDKRNVANIGMGDDDGRWDDVLTYERPGMDVFKAIFTSDDEESDEEKDYMDNDDKALPANGIMKDVDLATFNVTFILRGSKPKDAEKKEKKNKRQKSPKGGALVSFDVAESHCRLLPRAKNSEIGIARGRRHGRYGHEDMWVDVEKSPPYIIKALPIIDMSSDEGDQVSGQASGPPGARKRAIDFM